MAIHLLEKTPDYQLGIWKIEEDEKQLQLLSGTIQRPGHVNQVRRLEHLAVRAIATAMDIQSMDIAYLPSGKPYLLNNEQSISISHTKNYVAVLLSHHQWIGVDLEHRSERIHKIRHKFMHPEEELSMRQFSNPKDETVALLLHWCAKEALFKAVPEEGVDFTQELRICEFTTIAQSGRFKGCFLRTGKEFEIDYYIGLDFVLTCSFSAESR